MSRSKIRKKIKQVLFKCPICNTSYTKKKQAKKCQTLCRKNKNSNLEIARYAVKTSKLNTKESHVVSKQERRISKKEERRMQRQRKEKFRLFKKYLSFLAVFIILILVVYFSKFVKQKRLESGPKIEVTPKTYNFGQVIASEGVVETSFELKNEGFQPLIIREMRSSCACTTAVLEIDGEESPIFGMHNNLPDWSTVIEPQEVVKMKIMFDPNFHKDTFGPVTRTVEIFSNDPWNKQEKITINVFVQQ